MSVSKIKARAMEGAMKFMQSDKGQKIMSNPDVQKAMSWGFQTAFKVKNNVQQAKRGLAKSFAVATEDDLKEMKRTLERLERRVKKMNDAAAGDGEEKPSRSRKKA
jgi:hypothetical protein